MPRQLRDQPWIQRAPALASHDQNMERGRTVIATAPTTPTFANFSVIGIEDHTGGGIVAHGKENVILGVDSPSEGQRSRSRRRQGPTSHSHPKSARSRGFSRRRGENLADTRGPGRT